jgi:leader peptidase (prepilin peptidase) / N-methyltransferase
VTEGSALLLAALIAALITAPLVGSFLGTLVLRLPEGRPVVAARSACPHCGTRLGAPDLVPLLSFALFRGKCRHCGARLDRLYPIIELAALVVAIWAALVVPVGLLWPTSLLGWTLLALAEIDRRHMILPDLLTLPLLALGLLVTWWLEPAALMAHAVAAALGFVVFAGIARAYRRLRGREGLGLGDAKLLASAGAWVGPLGLPGVVLLGAASALAAALVQGLARGRLRAVDRIPFCPYLALGLWLVWLYGPPLLAPIPSPLAPGPP